MHDEPDLGARFRGLDRDLWRLRPFWQLQPFHHRTPPWAARAPDLWQWLSALSDADFAALTAAPQACGMLNPWLPGLTLLAQRCALPRLTGAALAPDPRLAHAVPGRKWQQLTAFAPLVPGAEPVLEWCAGKGHLGRLLAGCGGRAVTSLERDEALCRAGATLARRAGVAMRFDRIDVLQPAALTYLQTGVQAVALHACGDLHRTLLRGVAHHPVAGLVLSPCCYHLTAASHYRPLSAAAARSRLRLDRADLHMVVQQTVTAPRRMAAQGCTEVTWRLAFDELQRDCRRRDTYLNLPAMPRHLLREDFDAFARWAASSKGLDLPARWSPQRYLLLGESRYRALRRMEWVQHVFQRPLELWLVLDYALLLQEQGYAVEVGEFCAPELTPRNLLLRAQGRPGSAA